MRTHRLLPLLLVTAVAQASWAASGELERIVVHGRSLEDNVAGESADRSVYVYLPPDYAMELDRRYPVLYLLHGIADHNDVWVEPWGEESEYATLPDLMDRGIREGRVRPMIVVMPDARTSLTGCFYANSQVKGRWTDFIATELVAEIDARYRTVVDRRARGIAGHSMGGHGALRLGFLRPEVFSVVYGLNSALADWGEDVSIENPLLDVLPEIEGFEDLPEDNFYPIAVIGVSQAFSPNPDRPPFFVDLPFGTEGGILSERGPGWDRWNENLLVNLVVAHEIGARRLIAIRFDTALTDEFSHIPSSNHSLSSRMTELGIPHTFEMYNGDHRNRLWGKWGRLYTEVLPYFSDLLAVPQEETAVTVGVGAAAH
jgi:S-formylglutathione hydrolase FrmB